MKRNFEGKVALVTGSSRGIGRALALRLGREGAEVVVHYRRNAQAAEEVVQAVRSGGGEAWSVAGDIEDLDAVNGIFDAVRERHGRLDCFVANAAAAAFKSLAEIHPYHLDRTWAVNVRSFVVSVQRAVELMPAGGRIVAVTSYGSVRSFPSYGNLGAAKAAVEAWVRFMADELGPRDINVNAVNGGIIDTDSSDYFYGRPGMPAIASVVSRIPKRRLGTAEEVAAAIAFLLSDDAAYITGATLMVDGGLTVVAPPYRADVPPAD